MIRFNIPMKAPDTERYIQEAIESRALAGDGPFAKKCEELIEKKIGSKKFFLAPSGTAALELACMLCGIGPDDEMIVPSYTFSTSAASSVQFGGRPVFVDIRPDTMNIDETKIEAAITEKTKAIMVVHYAAVGCEMDTTCAIAKKHGLYVIEDAAQALNATYKGRYLGTIGDVGCFSFHATKNYNMGEGGGISVNNPEMIERAYHMRDSGTDSYDFERGMVSAYTWVEKGSSYLPSDLQCAYLYPQLLMMDEIKADRLKSWQRYYEGLRPLEEEGRIDLLEVPEYCDHNGHIFYVKCKDNEEREALRLFLKERGIQAVFHYQPLHASKAGKRYGRFCGEDVYTTKDSSRLLRLPLYYGLTTEDLDTVVKTVKEFYGRA
ncbi:MAG: dTDP-4-amino-4,6-dideoxygalactose transaminase [Erysipelotrichaceae bacterium]|nr:dTDP-4-amino-4,6-dideoxygalactose transaminase [Erysipelotrichaceae bacterium]